MVARRRFTASSRQSTRAIPRVCRFPPLSLRPTPKILASPAGWMHPHQDTPAVRRNHPKSLLRPRSGQERVGWSSNGNHSSRFSEVPPALAAAVLGTGSATAQTTYELVHAFRNSGGPTMLVRAADGRSMGRRHGVGLRQRKRFPTQLIRRHRYAPQFRALHGSGV